MTDKDEELLAELLLRWEELREKGQETPASELCREHSHLLSELTRRIQILTVTSWLDQPLPTNADSSEPSAQSSPQSKILLGRYRLDALIAEGGFAQVWRGYYLQLHRHVAVKVPKPNRLQSADSFMAEARRVARLKHPGIVPVFDFGQDGDFCFIVSEFVEGGSLGDHLVKNPPAQQQVLRWIIDIAEALDYAHLHGVIHRDVKPANILIDHHGRALLADFGIAQSANRAGQQALSLGTLRYMSPEQLEGRSLDPSSDIFSLGVVLHEALTGNLPYSSIEPTVLRREIIAGAKIAPGTPLPHELKQICQKALQLNPLARYSSAAHFAAALRRCLSPSKPPATHRWAYVIFGILGCAIMLGIAVLIRNGQPAKETAQYNSDKTVPNMILQPEADSFFFDGQSRIITPVTSFFPCTLEAWARTTGDQREQFIIGSDVPSFYGIGFGINNNFPIVETIRGGFDVEKPIMPGEWTHLAAVFGPTETKLFLNGQQIGIGPATQAPPRETPFVIGNVGEDHHDLYFHGQVRCLRISRGERYSEDFEPEPLFSPDADEAPHQAVLIFDGSKIEGGWAIDLSGKGNDGEWMQTKN